MTSPSDPERAQSGAVERQPATIYEVLRDLARDPSVDVARIAGLMDLQIKAEDRNAEREFNAAFARLKFPPIKKTAKGQGTTKYAPLDEVQAVVNPILASEGFTFTFSTAEPDEKAQVRMIGDLIHVGGHAKPYGLTLPAEKTGQMNNTQAVVSATSYGMRALYKLAFSLEFVGEDDDGRSIGYISEKQADNLRDLMHEMSFSPEAESKFLATFGCKALSELPKGAYTGALNLLEAKRRSMAEKAK